MAAGTAFNLFGWETRASLERLSLAPVNPSALIAAKNAAFWLLAFSQSFFLFPLIFLKFGGAYMLIGIAKTISLCLLCSAWGNRLSIRFPFRMNSYEFSLGGSISAALAAMMSIALLTNLPDLSIALGTAAQLSFNLILSATSFLIYRLSLRSASRDLTNRWDDITARVS